MKKLVSVIVPVYNSEPYLVNCLRYLVNQSLQEIEIVAVNDCSTDQSPAILEECLRQYKEKMVVIHTGRNLGPGGARNLGIKAASGDYIGFVDHDDQVELSMYEKLYHKALEGDYDMVDSAFFLSKQKRAILATPEAFTGDLDLDKRKKLMRVKGYLWSKLYKKSLLIDNQITLLENTPFDDSTFLCYIYGYAKRIAVVKEVLYFYREHDASFSHNLSVCKLADKWMEAMRDMAYYINRLEDASEYQEVLGYRIYDYYGKLLNAYMLEDGLFDLGLLEELRCLVSELVPGFQASELRAGTFHEDFARLARMNDKDPKELILLKRTGRRNVL